MAQGAGAMSRNQRVVVRFPVRAQASVACLIPSPVIYNPWSGCVHIVSLLHQCYSLSLPLSLKHKAMRKCPQVRIKKWLKLLGAFTHRDTHTVQVVMINDVEKTKAGACNRLCRGWGCYFKQSGRVRRPWHRWGSKPSKGCVCRNKSIPGLEDNKCKGLEMGACLECSRNSK